ncbi:hypothetical protein ECO2687_15219, partial [Escherichia coli O157:H- str. H 2687]
MKQQKGDVNRPDRHLFNRHSDGTGNEERPLRGAIRTGQTEVAVFVATNLRSKRPGGGVISRPPLMCQASSTHPRFY